MRIRSIGELTSSLDQQLALCKRELTTIKFLIEGCRTHQKSALQRAGVCLIYAHWQGFVNKAAECYLSYVMRQGLNYADLTPSLVALGIRGRINNTQQTNKLTLHTEFVELLLSDIHEPASLPVENPLGEVGNLKIDVLLDYLCLLNADTSRYELEKGVVEGKLLYYRNNIAHGEMMELDDDEYVLIHDSIIKLLDWFNTDVVNAAINEAFKR